ncbi:MAG: S9 family peptidase [Bacteroidia bacterium]|nr:S9 family peptidase [Bacteroidia bacterium]
MKNRIILVSLVLISICFNSIQLRAQTTTKSKTAKKDIALEDIWLYYKFVPGFPEEFNWMNDDQYYSVLEENKIVKYGIKDRKPVQTILDLGELKFGVAVEDKVEAYSFSDDEKKLLLKTKVEQIYRHSTKDQCFVYDMESKKLTTLHNGDLINFANFSPDGSRIGYLFENNIYYYDFKTGKEVQVTNDGKINSIINGGTDWVNEEEFAFTRAFYWSPDNQKIAFMRFDESNVKEFSMDKYGSLYPEPYKFKYPKAGEDNAVIRLFVYDLATQKSIELDPGPDLEFYIPRATWTQDANTLAVMRMPRLQNQVEIVLYDAKSGQGKTILTEKSDTYISEVSDNTWYFLKNGKGFIWQSERDGFNHLYMYDMQGTLVRQITKGDWEVTELCSVDEANETIYFLSTEVSAVSRHLYSIPFAGGSTKKLSKAPGWHSASFSSNNSYYLDTWSTIENPPTSALFDKKGKEVLVLEDNAKLRETMAGYNMSKPQFFEMKTSEAVMLNGWMIKPPDFDEKKKYPVLMYVYGGPGSQTVTDEFGMFNYIWYQMLAQMGYIVVSVDNRGTGGRGADFKKSTYADLGNLETVDQIEAAKWLAGQPYVDGNRIGIWGWSFGGYMTSLCLTKGGPQFKMGIAVAPVTNWRFYDTIYTERYLKTPQINPKGYDENSPINFAKQLDGHYMVIHGTADDNVHFQNTVEWVDALVKANKQFDLMFYPNKNHGIYGGVTRFHLYKKMTDYILANL